MTTEPPRSSPRPPQREDLTLDERARLRERELQEAQAAAEANPGDEGAAERLALARRAFAAGMTAAQYEAIEREALSLLATNPTHTAVALLQQRTGLSERSCYRWIERALGDRQRLGVVAYRQLIVDRAEATWASALWVGDPRAAVAALALAAKLSGAEPSKRIEHSGKVETVQTPGWTDGRPDWLKNEACAEFFITHRTHPWPGVMQQLTTGQRDPHADCGREGCVYCSAVYAVARKGTPG